MRFIGYVTVRLNSKRVFQKSIRYLGDKPLVNYPITTLNRVNVDEIILYSHDNLSLYIDDGLKYEWKKRAKKYDGDRVTFNNVLDSVIDKLDADYIVYLSCTSPFIKAETINKMISAIKTGKYDSAFTANKYKTFAWFNGKPLNYNVADTPHTQNLKPILLETSGLYIFSKKLYKNSHRRIGVNPYVKEVDLVEGWDIDTEFDFTVAQMFWYHGCY